MSTIYPLYKLMTKKLDKYSRKERIYLEAGFFSFVCKELKEVFRKRYCEYFRLMNCTIEMENTMLDADFISLIIKDIISTNEYNLQGIAHYINIHEDVIHEIITGQNSNPSAILLQKIIDLHYSVRGDLYREITKKIASEYFAVA